MANVGNDRIVLANNTTKFFSNSKQFLTKKKYEIVSVLPYELVVSLYQNSGAHAAAGIVLPKLIGHAKLVILYLKKLQFVYLFQTKCKISVCMTSWRAITRACEVYPPIHSTFTSTGQNITKEPSVMGIMVR